MWNTRVTEMLGIQYPIIQGAYGGFGTSAIATPVSEAGGLGLITAGAFNSIDKLREDIRKAKSNTDKPVGVNLTAMGMISLDEVCDVVIDEKVPVVETAGYRCDVYGKRLKESGIIWIHKVATMKHALAAERQGADAVVVVGLEGAGFKSTIQLPTMIAIPWAAKELKVPVIGAGGIADAHGFMATLAMGAEAVYLGTAFMATKECPIPDAYKQLLVDGDPVDPKFRDRNLAPPNPEDFQKVMSQKGTVSQDEWLMKLERVLLKESPDDLPKEMPTEIPVEEVLKLAPGSLAVAVIDKVKTVKELIDEMISGAEDIRRRWSLA
ncbi:MAG: nitronate monooxygenase [Chloroflexota bacterium]|nr:nitronate monooxygenase [Chloroflexota bacterium]